MLGVCMRRGPVAAFEVAMPLIAYMEVVFAFGFEPRLALRLVE